MLPKFLYKFRRWDDNFHKRLLTHNEIFLSSPIKFNDPFDCTISVRYDKANKQEIFRETIEYIQQANPLIGRAEARRLAIEQMRKGIYKDPDHLERFYKEFQPQTRFRNFGILSLTEDARNIVMWSHYADSHKGFCVGFDAEKLSKLDQTIYQQLGEKIKLGLYKVEYQVNYPFFDAFKMNEEEFVVKPLIAKSCYWEYEKEYRLITKNRTNQPIQLSDGIILRIILGCKMSTPYKEEIKDFLKNINSPIELFEAKLKTESFGLNFERVVY